MYICFTLLFFLFFSSSSNANQNECTLDTNEFLKKSYQLLNEYHDNPFQFTKAIWTSDNEFKIFGMIDGKENVLGKILVIKSENKIMSFDIFVHKSARGKGIQNILYAEALNKFRDIKQIYHTLDGTNLDVYLHNLANILIHRFSLPYPDPFKYEDPIKFFNKCCSLLFSEMAPTLKKHFASEALKFTPAYKSSQRFGFPKICKLEFIMDSTNIVFTSCP